MNGSAYKAKIREMCMNYMQVYKIAKVRTR